MKKKKKIARPTPSAHGGSFFSPAAACQSVILVGVTAFVFCSGGRAKVNSGVGESRKAHCVWFLKDKKVGKRRRDRKPRHANQQKRAGRAKSRAYFARKCIIISGEVFSFRFFCRRVFCNQYLDPSLWLANKCHTHESRI